jgi:hypothetical protein
MYDPGFAVMVYVGLLPQGMFEVVPPGIIIPPGDCTAVIVKLPSTKLATMEWGAVTFVNV